MVEKPENWDQLTPEEKRTLRLEAWVAGDNIEFESPEAKRLYRQRATLFKDAVELKKAPERVPIAGLGGAFAQRRAGVPQKATMYDDWDKAAQSFVDFHMDFQPDSMSFLFLNSGPSMELVGQNNMKWAGHGLHDDAQYQHVEQEYMKADEYDLFLDDPTDFFLRYYWPRFQPKLKALEKLPRFGLSNLGMAGVQMSFLDEDIQQAFELIRKAAAMSVDATKASMGANEKLKSLGFPGFSPMLAAAPYDALGDSLRGTRGIMMDLFRQPENIKKACEKISKMMQTQVPDPPLGESPLVLIPLHKGAEGFMSQAQYEEFYWPTFKEVLLKMIDKGIIPVPFAEGTFTDRLKCARELPKASTVWFLDRTDMRTAKDILGGHSCLMGNIPISLVSTGTYEAVASFTKNLIDTCGEGGGLILSPSTQIDDGKEETVQALVDTAKNHIPKWA